MPSVGVGIIGREVTFDFGGSALLGVVSKGVNFSNEMGETTDDDSSGWTEFLATPLKKQAEFTISGTLKNLELVAAYFAASNIFAVIITYPDGSVITMNCAMTGAPQLAHESNVVGTYEASFTSSGSITWAAGV